MFVRRSVIHERNLYFDPRWRVVGDFHWVLALLKQKVPMMEMDSFTSVFADTGDNLCLSPRAISETREKLAMAPAWVRALKPLWIVQHRLRRLAAGHFSLNPASYLIYTLKSPEHRVRLDVPRPTAIWWNRM